MQEWDQTEAITNPLEQIHAEHGLDPKTAAERFRTTEKADFVTKAINTFKSPSLDHLARVVDELNADATWILTGKKPEPYVRYEEYFKAFIAACHAYLAVEHLPIRTDPSADREKWDAL